MTSIRNIAIAAVASLTVATAFAPAAEARYYRGGGAVAAGIIGGLAVGALIAGSTRPAYAAPGYYAGGADCYRRHVGYTPYGRPVFRTVCY